MKMNSSTFLLLTVVSVFLVLACQEASCSEMRERRDAEPESRQRRGIVGDFIKAIEKFASLFGFGGGDKPTEAEPTEAEPTPTEAEPTPTEAEPTPTEAEPTPTEAEPTPTEAA